MRVKSTLSGFCVTFAGAEVPLPPPPLKVVWEKLDFSRTFRFRYQFRPTDHAPAEWAEVFGSAKDGNAAGSMSSSAYRLTNCNAPQPPSAGLNGRRGITPPAKAASSPVNTHEAVTSHAVLS